MNTSVATLQSKIFVVFSIIFLIYLLLPGPSSITNFPALPESVKSTLEGDTIQVPNVSAYFSKNYRDFATKYYFDNYKQNTWIPLFPIRLNYPPEFAFKAIKDQTDSTYLEEFVYPLRDSLYINGMEPFLKTGQPRYWGASYFEVDKKVLDTKVTLRFYPTSVIHRVVIWIGILSSIYMLWKTSKEVLQRA